MNKVYKTVAGLALLCAIGAEAQDSIISDDFSGGSIIKEFARIRDTDIDVGWVGPHSDHWGYTSGWDISGGVMQNSATNAGAYPDYIPAEGGVVQVVSFGGSALPAIHLTFDYDVAAGDTLFVHLWGLDGTFDGDGDWFVNIETGAGGLGDETDNGGGNDDGVVAYSLKDGLRAPSLGASGSQALVSLTGSGTYSNTITIASLGLSGINDTADFEYYLLSFCRQEDGLPGTTQIDHVELEATPDYVVAEAPLQENLVFPDQNVLASQLLKTESPAGWNYVTADPGPDAMCGQSFELSSAQTLRAITFQKQGGLTLSENDTHEFKLWIGEYDSKADPANHVVGATLYEETFDVSGVTFIDQAWYTFNLASNLNLDANTEYAFQVAWSSLDPVHVFHISRYYEGAGGTDTYTDGTIVYQQAVAGVVPAVSLINEPENDMVFAVHSSEVSLVASAVVDPDTLSMTLVSPATTVDTSLDFAFSSATHVEVTVTITDESHPGAYSVLSTNPQTLTDPIPFVHPIDFRYDNTLGGAVGTTATGLINIAWSEVGSGVIETIIVPISTAVSVPPGSVNVWDGDAGTMAFEDALNWSQDWVPGTLGEDRAIIQDGSTVNVTVTPPGSFNYDLEVQHNTDAGSVLNISADIPNLKNLKVGPISDWPGFANQTAGTVTVAEDLIVGGAIAPTNSIYTLTDGVMDNLGALTIGAKGIVRLEGGSYLLDSDNTGSYNPAINVAPGGVLEISGGTFSQGSGRVNNDGTVRIIGDEATITMKEIWQDTAGTFEFILDASGVSAVINKSWGHLAHCDFVIDGSAYAYGPQEILLYSGGWNGQALGSNYAVTGLGVEGVDWDLIEVEGVNTMDPHTVTLKIIGTPYEEWTASFGLTGIAAEWDSDLGDLDGENNLYEYAFGGDPTNAAVKGEVPTGRGVGDYFEYVYARNIGASNELSYLPEFGTSLVHTNWSGDDVVELSTGALKEGYESVTNRVDITLKPKGYMQVIVEQTLD